MSLEVSAMAGTDPGESITATDVLDAAPGAGVADVFVNYYRGVRARVLELPKYRTTGVNERDPKPFVHQCKSPPRRATRRFPY